MKSLKTRFKRFDKTAPTLYKEAAGNAGYDLFARLEYPIELKPGESYMIPLNLAMEIPFGIVGLLFQRSSTYKKWGIKLTNSVGVIDCIFSGDGDEWKGEFKNETSKNIVVANGDKICQVVFLQYVNFDVLREVDVLGNENRGGFGSSFNNASDLIK